MIDETGQVLIVKVGEKEEKEPVNMVKAVKDLMDRVIPRDELIEVPLFTSEPFKKFLGEVGRFASDNLQASAVGLSEVMSPKRGQASLRLLNIQLMGADALHLHVESANPLNHDFQDIGRNFGIYMADYLTARFLAGMMGSGDINKMALCANKYIYECAPVTFSSHEMSEEVEKATGNINEKDSGMRNTLEVMEEDTLFRPKMDWGQYTKFITDLMGYWENFNGALGGGKTVPYDREIIGSTEASFTNRFRTIFPGKDTFWIDGFLKSAKTKWQFTPYKNIFAGANLVDRLSRGERRAKLITQVWQEAGGSGVVNKDYTEFALSGGRLPFQLQG